MHALSEVDEGRESYYSGRVLLLVRGQLLCHATSSESALMRSTKESMSDLRCQQLRIFIYPEIGGLLFRTRGPSLQDTTNIVLLLDICGLLFDDSVGKVKAVRVGWAECSRREEDPTLEKLGTCGRTQLLKR